MTAPAIEAASVASFIEERCYVGLRFSVRFMALRSAWVVWSLGQRIPAGEDIEAWELSLQRALTDLLTVCDADGESWRYVGLGLKP